MATVHTDAAPGPRLQVAHFQRRPDSSTFSVEGLFEVIRAHLPADINAAELVVPGRSRGITPRIRNMIWASRHQRRVNHITGDIHYVALGMDPPRTILTILDCVHLTYASGLRRVVLEWLWYRLPVSRAAVVTVISDFTRQHLSSAIPVSPDKVKVIPACVDPAFVRTPRVTPARPTVLQVGTTPNKNVERIAEALSGLDCTLHVVGVLSEPQRAALAKNRIAYRNSVGLTKDEMIRAYADCDVLSFCSTYEGFGMPIVEAQRVGRPVVTSRLASMPEVAGVGACFVDPLDPRSIREGIERALTDQDFRAALTAAGFDNSQRFSPSRVASQYADLYREVAAAS
jgi:glycosyltransferase involved in cell wall biosynthesis